jgi:hypothetical protein
MGQNTGIASLRFLIVFFLLATIPSFAQARSFKSELKLKVFANGTDGKPDRYLGQTSPTSKAVDVPRSEFWYVRPVGSLSEQQMIDLAVEIRQKRIPGLDLSNRWDITDPSLSPLENISTLRFLLLAQTKVTDAGLEHLSGFSGLKFISLSSPITDKGIARLTPLKKLVGLDLTGTKLTDKGLATLKAFPELQTLVVSNTKVTDAGAKTIASLKSLMQLDISETLISDKGVAKLKGLDQLQILALGKKVTDAGLKPMASLKNLRILDATESRITSSGVVTLKQAPKLEELWLPWTTLNRTQVQALGDLPHVKRVVLNGKVMPPTVLERIRALAKATPAIKTARASS